MTRLLTGPKSTQGESYCTGESHGSKKENGEAEEEGGQLGGLPGLHESLQALLEESKVVKLTWKESPLPTPLSLSTLRQRAGIRLHST